MNKTLLVLCCVLPCLTLRAQVRPLPNAVYSLQLQLKDYKGGPVQDATVQLVGVLQGALNYRRVAGQQPRVLTAADFTGNSARLQDLPDGEFVLMVDSPMFARSLSQPFTVPFEKEPLITVTLARGGVLEGRVLGPDKKPVAGAVVRTENGGVVNTGPLAAMLATQLVDTLTAASATTAADGSFRLERLAHGKYRVVVGHAAFVPVEVEAEVAGDEPKQLPPVQLADGVLVIGRVVRGTKPVAGAKVMFQFEDMSAVKDPKLAMKVKSLETTTDDKGDFRLPSRVRPGTGYVLMAAEPGSPLAQAQQLAASRVKLDVKADKREQTELLLLPAK